MAPVESSADPVRLTDYFCLADGHTAALMTAAGACHFWCAPHFDSPLRLARVLDAKGGGSVGPTLPPGGAVRARWDGLSNALRLQGAGTISVVCSLVEDGSGGSALCWVVAGPAGLPIDLELGAPSAAGAPGWQVQPRGAFLPPSPAPDGPGGPLAVVASEEIRTREGRHWLTLPSHGLAIWLAHVPDPGALGSRLEQIRLGGSEAVRRSRDLQHTAAAQAERWASGLAGGATGLSDRTPGWAREALLRSLLTIRGLQDRASGLIVASPLTSIPQWPRSERAWDYRYAWLRDCADAGLALTRAGALEEAANLATGLARVLEGTAVSPVIRLDGSAVPDERLLSYLSGYGGAVVRIGNAAAGQAQVDTLGEVMRFVEALDRQGRCPLSLLARVPALADQAVGRWEDPDHGIWEVRGEPRHYVHSKLLAWTALDVAIKLADRGRVPATPAWVVAREQIAQVIRRRGTESDGRLRMAFDDPSADSSTLAAYLVGYLDPRSPGAAATLDFVTGSLGDGCLLARHRPERDGLPSPCAPFIFPALWAVVAESRLGRRTAARARLRSILRLAGPAGQLSEVAQPQTSTMLGNYPQIQSHAAVVEAVMELFGRR